MDLDTIRARLMAIDENMAIHIPCMAEAIATTPVAGAYFCYGCDKRVSHHEVAELDDRAAEHYVRDVRFLLRALDENKERKP